MQVCVDILARTISTNISDLDRLSAGSALPMRLTGRYELCDIHINIYSKRENNDAMIYIYIYVYI